MTTKVFWDNFGTFLIPLIHSFIPLFVAIDPIGIIPLYSSLTVGMTGPVRRHVAVQAIVTAFLIALAFLFVGRAVFQLLGITIADFQIAGGVLLFILAVIDLISSEKPERIPTTEIGVVPIGTPLIVGPAVLTVLLMTVDLYGFGPTILSILLNLLIMTGALLNADRILRLIGEGGARGTAKVVSLLLAAIGVMMVRRGIIAIFLQMKF
jgi:multiple antibiotic resistance protein